MYVFTMNKSRGMLCMDASCQSCDYSPTKLYCITIVECQSSLKVVFGSIDILSMDIASAPMETYLTRAFSVCAANCRLLTAGRILSRKGNMSTHYSLRKDYGIVDVIKCDTLFCSTRALIGERDAQSGSHSS